MKDHPLLELPHLGDPDLARTVASRAMRVVPACHRHLAGADPADWSRLPIADKTGYLLKHPYADLLADDIDQAFTIFSSSGSSGRSFYWPQLRRAGSVDRPLRTLLEQAFRIDHRPTLAVVGLALGSWIGGEHVSWMLKSLAASSPYPFTVFSPGNRHDEVLAMIAAADRYYAQVLLVVCPSAIGHLLLRARQQGIALPMAKLRFLVLGEPFPEPMRLDLAGSIQPPAGEPVMLSIFGSADTGVLGAESPASALVRGRCQQDPALAAGLGFGGVVPHLFHLADPSAFLECPAGELLVTRWQGIPLVRYNLHDAARLLSWRGLREGLLADGQVWAGNLPADLPDLLAVTGRADSCLLLCGTNLTEAMLDATVRSPELATWLTGAWRGRVVLAQNRQRLELTVECRDGMDLDVALIERLYPLVITALGRVQPEFKDDHENIYRRWDDDPGLRILDLRPCAWLALAAAGGIKQRGLAP